MNTIDRILVYIDGTDKSVVAAQYAISLASQISAELTALYVVNTAALKELRKTNIFLESEEEEYANDMDTDAGRYLNYIRELANEKGLTIEGIKRSGSVVQEITEAIEEREIDLLIMGEISKARSRRDEFYDQAERALRSAECSVLIAKDEERINEIFDSIT